MKIWLIQYGEQLPIDHGNPRLLRTGMLANMLADRGHHVTYWTSTFSHYVKKQRFKNDKDVDVRDNYKIKLLYSPGYHKNVSIKRIYDHIIMSRKFSKRALLEPKPDVIVCSMPTIELSLAATNYGKIFNVPTVLDLRDMWPDVFMEVVPTWAQGVGRLVLSPMVRNLKRACKNATAIFGITDEFLEWGLKHASRKHNSFDAVFYHSYNPVQPDTNAMAKAEAFWKHYGICPDNGQFIVCFFGYFGRQFDIETVLTAARELNSSRPNIRFVLCGDGDNFEHYRAMAADLNNVTLPGFIGYPEIWTLMKMSSVGLAPYRNTPSFIASLPNKVGEYLSAGLPIISSLKGAVEEFLRKNKCGVTYPNFDARQLASIILDFYENKKKLQDMAHKTKKVFQQNFLSDRVYGNMINKLEFISTKSLNVGRGHCR